MSTIRGHRRRRYDFPDYESALAQARIAHSLDYAMMVGGASTVEFNQIRLGDRICAAYIHFSGSVERYEFVVAGWGEQGQLVRDAANELAVARDEAGSRIVRRLYRLPR